MRGVRSFERCTMSDDVLKRGQPDRSRINMHEDYEVKYWQPTPRRHTRGIAAAPWTKLETPRVPCAKNLVMGDTPRISRLRNDAGLTNPTADQELLCQ